MSTDTDTDTISLKDFKQWLIGVQEFLADDWTPDEQEWATIKDKIDMIEETIITVPQQTPAPFTPIQTRSMYSGESSFTANDVNIEKLATPADDSKGQYESKFT